MTAPVVVSNCADCGIGTITAGEWYMVKDEIWDEAWGALANGGTAWPQARKSSASDALSSALAARSWTTTSPTRA